MDTKQTVKTVHTIEDGQFADYSWLRRAIDYDNSRLHCKWCYRYVDSLSAGEFCTEECANSHRVFMLQTNCEWCFGTIEKRVAEKYCCSECKEKHMHYIQSAEKRKGTVTLACVLFALCVMLPLALLEYLLLAYMIDFGWIIKGAGAGISGVVVIVLYVLPIMYLVFYPSTYSEVDRKVHTEGLYKFLDYPSINRSGFYVDGYSCPRRKCDDLVRHKVALYQQSSLIFVCCFVLPLVILIEYLIGYNFGYKEHMHEWAALTLLGSVFVVFDFIFPRIERNLTRGLLSEEHRKGLEAAFDILLEGKVTYFGSGNTPDQYQRAFMDLCEQSPQTIFAMAKSVVDRWYTNNISPQTELLYQNLHAELSSSLNVKLVKVTRSKDSSKKAYDCVLHLRNNGERNIRVEDFILEYNKDGNRRIEVRVDVLPHEDCEVRVNSIETYSIAKKINVKLDKITVKLDSEDTSELTVYLSSHERFHYQYDKFLKLIGHERPIPA
jgi:hypothetical protein